MDKEYLYHDLPYPFSHCPTPGEPVTATTVSEVIVPLLQTVHCFLEMLANRNASGYEELPLGHLDSAVEVLEGHQQLAITLLQRLGEAGAEQED